MSKIILRISDGSFELDSKGDDQYKIYLRVPGEGASFDYLSIVLSKKEILEIPEILSSRKLGEYKLGKAKGFYKEFLRIKREEEHYRQYIELNSWFCIFGSSLGVRVSKKEALKLSNLIENNF